MHESQQENNNSSFICYNKPIVLNQCIRKLLKHGDTFQLHYLNLIELERPIKNQIQEVEIFFSFIDAWKVQNFLIQGHYSNCLQFQRIFSSIESIKFTQLKQVNLWKCSIQSIQNLPFCNFPWLEMLWLDDNCITSIKSLRKCYLPNIKKLSLRGNFIKTCDFLTSSDFPQLELLVLEYWKEDPVFSEDLCWLAKMQNSQVDQIELDSISRIKQRRVVEQLGQKYKNAKLFLKPHE